MRLRRTGFRLNLRLMCDTARRARSHEAEPILNGSTTASTGTPISKAQPTSRLYCTQSAEIVATTAAAAAGAEERPASSEDGCTDVKKGQGY